MGASTDTAQKKLERHALRVLLQRAKKWRALEGPQFPWGHPRCVRPKDAWLLIHLALKLLDMKQGQK